MAKLNLSAKPENSAAVYGTHAQIMEDSYPGMRAPNGPYADMSYPYPGSSETEPYQLVTHSFSDEISQKVNSLKQLNQRINKDYDEAGWWHNLKDALGIAKPLPGADVLEQRSILQRDIGESYSYFKITGKSPMEQALIGDQFATLPRGVTYNLGNINNVMGQLSSTLANPDLTQDEQMALRGAYVNVMARGNVEGVLKAEVDKQLFIYAVGSSNVSGSMKGPSRSFAPEVYGRGGPGRFVPYQAPAQQNYTQKPYQNYGNAGYTDARGNSVAQGLPNTTSLSTSGSRVDANGRVVPNTSARITYRTAIATTGLDEQVEHLTQMVPGLSKAQTRELLQSAFNPNKPVEVVIGGSRVRSYFGKGTYRADSDLDIGFDAKMKKSQIDNILDAFDNAGALKSERGIRIFSGNNPPSGLIVSPQEFFQRSGIRGPMPPERAGQPFFPSGYISVHPNGTITIVPPNVNQGAKW